MPPTLTEEIISDAVHPVPLTVIDVPAGPEVGEKVAVPFTVKALIKVWAPLLEPVMTISLAPPVVEGTVIVPERTLLSSTVREKVAIMPPTVTEEIVSDAAHPPPLTVIKVPAGPEVGEKVADTSADTGTVIINPKLITSTRAKANKILKIFLFTINLLGL
jgi:septum formation inhibitor-activating ATPase MinD